MASTLEKRFRHFVAGITPVTRYGIAIGFVLAYCFMRWGYWLMSSSVGEVVEVIVRLPSYTLSLVPQLIANRFLSYTDITLYTAASWAIIFGIEAVVWQRIWMRLRTLGLDWKGRVFPVMKGLLSLPAIFGVVLGSWFFSALLCLPFGTCLFRSNFTSIESPGMPTLSQMTGLRFPPGTRLLCSDHGSFQGAYDFEARLELPRSALLRMMKSLPPAHRASAKEIDIQNGDVRQPWGKLNVLDEMDIVEIPAKGFARKSSLWYGKLWISSGDPEKAVIYLTGNGHT